MMFMRQQKDAPRRIFSIAIPFVLTVVIGMALFVVRTGRAQTVIPLSDCTTISSSGSYLITQDISKTDPSGHACLIIAANDVTLDGGGKTVTVNKTDPTDTMFAVNISDDVLPNQYWRNITVKNLTSNLGVRILGDTISDVRLDNLHVWQILNEGGDDVTITNNTVGAGGISISGYGQPTWRPMRTVVRDNTVTGGIPDVSKLFEIGGTGPPCMQFDTVVEYNTIIATHSAETYGGLTNDEASAVRIICATHTRFANNTIRSTGFARGIILRDESNDGVYENNTVITNTDPALWIPSGNLDKTHPSRNTFRNNIFRTEAGYVLYAKRMGSQNLFTDNVFYGKDDGILSLSGGYRGNTFDHNTFYNADLAGSTIGLMEDNTEGPPADTYTNNIFSYNNSTEFNSVFGFDKWLPSRYDGDYNIFYNRGGALEFWSIGNLAAWRTTTGDDANSINLDPLLVNPTGGNFTLQSGSPAINAASDGTDIGARQTVALCPENWTCVDWSVCSGNTQARTCTDANSCGTTANRPTLTQSCTEPPITDTTSPAAVTDLRAE